MAKLMILARLLGRSGRRIVAGVLFLLSIIVGHKVSVGRAEKRGRQEGENEERLKNDQAVVDHRKKVQEVVRDETKNARDLRGDRDALRERMRREARDAGGDR